MTRLGVPPRASRPSLSLRRLSVRRLSVRRLSLHYLSLHYLSLLCALLPALSAAAPPVLRLPTTTQTRVSPEDALKRANRAYTFGDYEGAVQVLTPVVEPEMEIRGLSEQVRAFELLGLSHWYLGQNDASKRYFRRMILVNPDKELDPRLVPPPIIEFYEDLRQDLAEDIKRSEAELRKRIEEEERQRRERNALIKEVTYKENSLVVALLPFGVGQFQNGDETLGWIFLTAEVAAITLSVSFLYAAESLRQPNGFFRPEEADLARNLQTAQIISGGAAIGLMVAGIVHSVSRYRERVEIDLNIIRPGGPQGAPAGATLQWRW